MYRYAIVFAAMTTRIYGLSCFSNENKNQIPQIDQWEVLKDGTLTGIVKGHPVLDDFEEMITSPLLNPLPRFRGDIAKTRSGCQYKLVSPKKKKRRIIKSALPSLFSQKITPANNTKMGRPGAIPSIDDWKIDSSTGRLTGLVTGHSHLPDGDLISTTTPIDDDLKEGMIIKTKSGSRYKLESPKKLNIRMAFNAFGIAAAEGVVDILGLNSIGSSDAKSDSESSSNSRVKAKDNNKMTNPSTSGSRKSNSNSNIESVKLQQDKEMIEATNNVVIKQNEVVDNHNRNEAKVNEKVQTGDEKTARCEDQQWFQVIESAEQQQENKIEKFGNETEQSLTKEMQPAEIIKQNQQKGWKVNGEVQIEDKEAAPCEDQPWLQVIESAEQQQLNKKNVNRDNEIEQSPTKGNQRPHPLRTPKESLGTSLKSLTRRLREGKLSSKLIGDPVVNTTTASVTAFVPPILPNSKKIYEPKSSSTNPLSTQSTSETIFARNVTDKLKFIDEIDGLLIEVKDVLTEVDDHFKNVSTVQAESVSLFVGNNTIGKLEFVDEIDGLLSEVGNVLTGEVDDHLKNVSMVPSEPSALFADNSTDIMPKIFQEGEPVVGYSLDQNNSREKERKPLDQKLEESIDNGALQSPVQSEKEMCDNVNHDALEEEKRGSLDTNLEEFTENNCVPQSSVELANKVRHVFMSNDASKEEKRNNLDKQLENLIKNERIEQERFERKELLLAAEIKEKETERFLIKKKRGGNDGLIITDTEAKLEIFRRSLLEKQMKEQKAAYQSALLEKELLAVKERENTHNIMKQKERRQMLARSLSIQQEQKRMSVEKEYAGRVEKNRRGLLAERLKQKQMQQSGAERLWQTKLEKVRRSMLVARLVENCTAYQLLQEKRFVLVEVLKNTKAETKLERLRRILLGMQMKKQKNAHQSILRERASLRIEKQVAYEITKENERRRMLASRLNTQREKSQSEQKKMLEKLENVRQKTLLEEMLTLEQELSLFKEQQEKTKEKLMLEEILKENQRRQMLAYRLDIQKMQAQSEETKKEIVENKIFESQLEKNRRNLLKVRLKHQRFLFQVELETKNLKWKIETERARRQMLSNRLVLQLVAKSKEEAVTASKRKEKAEKKAEEAAIKAKEELRSIKLVELADYVNHQQEVAVAQDETNMINSDRLIELKRLEVEFGMPTKNDESSPNIKQDVNALERELLEASSRLENTENFEEVYADEEQQSEQNEESSSISEEQKSRDSYIKNELSITTKQEIEIKKERLEKDKLKSLENTQIVEAIFGSKDDQLEHSEASSISGEQRNHGLELDEHAEKITESDLSYIPSDRVLANLPLLMNEIAGISLDKYDAKERYFTGRNVAIHADSTLSIPLRISTPGTIVEFSVTKNSYDFGFGIIASLDSGEIVKIMEMGPFLKHASTEKILVPIGSAPCIMQFKFQNNHSTLLEKVSLSYKIKVTPPSVNTIQLGRRRRARATLDLLEHQTLKNSCVKMKELQREVEYLEKEMNKTVAKIESLLDTKNFTRGNHKG